ncbi:alpha/beta hydrolase domain-containing protein [Nocardia alni]|uniref:alpha/beta hydrolase domain-containing protein n=1 Tax=Nocardia alni TaxID=2815723 RepID=UPI001C22C3A0|nr:alpha/beta hydrolase domain-containing protein [Nocardia alni]
MTLCCAAVLVLVVEPGAAQAQPAVTSNAAAEPLVTGPISGGDRGHPEMDAPFRVGDYGYGESEYFLAGTAKAYGTQAAPAPYATRIVVYRPLDPARFSGNVVTEWANTTGQIDAPVELVWSYPQLFATGDAIVEITAQQVGVCGLGLSGTANDLGGVCTPTSLKGFDPNRYRPLGHPGDDYSYDIFSQAVRAVRRTGPTQPLGGLTARHVIAVGESQSAIALDNYILTGADRDARVVDGFVIDADGHTAEPASYRVPTVTVWSEESARPGPTSGPNHVTWSVAGAAHTDHWLLASVLGWAGHSLLGQPAHSAAEQEASAVADGNYGQEGPGASLTCAGNDEFPRRYVVDAAIADTEAWVADGTAAPAASPFEFTGLERAVEPMPPAGAVLDDVTRASDPVLGNINALAILGAPAALARDGDGNAVGGLRLAPISVPVASYDGSACIAAGTTAPFSPDRLRQLYPTHADYVARMIEAVRNDVARRYLTARDGTDLLARACGSAIPDFGTTPLRQQPPECGHLRSLL